MFLIATKKSQSRSTLFRNRYLFRQKVMIQSLKRYLFSQKVMILSLKRYLFSQKSIVLTRRG
jgi:hypothetical protein